MKWLKSWYDGEGLLGMKARRAIWSALKLPESDWVNEILDQQDQIHNSLARKTERANYRRQFVGTTLPLILAAAAGLSFAITECAPNLIGLPVAMAIFLVLGLVLSAIFWPN